MKEKELACKYEDKIIQQGEDMAEIKTELKYQSKELKEIKQDLKEFVTCADKKYANKKLEVWFYGLIGFIVTTVIGIIITRLI